MSMPQAPGGPAPGQGSAGSTDLATKLAGIISQLSAANTNMLTLIAAVKAVNFPQNVKGYLVASLPSSPTIGQMAYVTDGASGAAWGTTPTGGHSTKYLCWFNGSAWTIVGE
jgi:hypothetical protein